MRTLFRDDEEKDFFQIPFEASYGHLQSKLKDRSGRQDCDLGNNQFSSCISKLYGIRRDDRQRDYTIASAFLVFIQMLSESMRLRKFNRKVADVVQPTHGVYGQFQADEFDMSCQNNWRTLSEAILEQNKVTDKLKRAITLGFHRVVDTVRKAKKIVQLLKRKRCEIVLSLNLCFGPAFTVFTLRQTNAISMADKESPPLLSLLARIPPSAPCGRASHLYQPIYALIAIVHQRKSLFNCSSERGEEFIHTMTRGKTN
ncbi:unnamed protein product [Cuscuta epithymum]|uniref:rRNA N-glycosylase n=1 Tax=Cuscuta epithymum TaxID=186058 RepID=A0AAV0GKP4_9ASTE|nr:unnamed protein product [Cuscuta epithymum]